LYSYKAYGLGIHSAVALPELVPSEVKADVFLTLGSVSKNSIPPNSIEWAQANSEETLLYYKGVGTFLVRKGNTIIADPAPEANENLVRFVILTRALATILDQRKFIVLHGSSLGINGHGAVFLGESQQGKSTLAAFFHRRGHSLLSDDLTAIQVEDGTPPLVFPGFPEFRLWPDTILAFGEELKDWDAAPHRAKKRTCQVMEGFSDTPFPLKKIYVLEEGPELAIEPLSPQEAFVELMRHSITAGILKGSGRAPEHLLQCGNLIKTGSIAWLKRPRSLEILSALAEMVEKDLFDTNSSVLVEK